MKFKIFVTLILSLFSALSNALEIWYGTGYESYDDCRGSPRYKSAIEACSTNWEEYESHSVSAAGGQGNMLGDPPHPSEEPYVTGPTCIAHAGGPWRQVVKLCVSIDFGRNLGEDCDLPYVGNPINAATGNKFQKEIDFSSESVGLHFNRYYNSILGANWSHSYSDYIDMDLFGKHVSYVNPNGSVDEFDFKDGTWKGATDSNTKMSGSSSTNWVYEKENGEILSFNAKGKLISIKKRGLTTTLKYSTSTDVNTEIPKVGLLMEITNNFGASLKLRYQGSRISKLIDPNGNQISYLYDTLGRLEEVLYADSSSKKYLYNEPEKTQGANLPNVLTGIINENGIRYATFSYDIHGRAVSSEHGNGIDKFQLDHSGEGTSILLPNLTTSTYSYQIVQGKALISNRTQPAGSGCNASEKKMQYDGNGNLTSSTDFNGVKTSYEYDQTRNLEISRTVGVGTLEQHIIKTQWDENFRLPTRISKPNLMITYAYDSNGNISTKTRQATTDSDGSSGFAAALIGPIEKFTYEYTSYGKVLKVDGPRSDVNDVTSYTYNPKGLISTIKNALGHITTFNNYDANGNLLLSTDPNGIATSFEYDSRNRLVKSVLVNPSDISLSATTTFEYDHVGNIINIIFPTGTKITHEYDDANRLVSIQNEKGERIEYTLDENGNRLNEIIKDSSGAVSHSIKKNYDDIGRLIKLLGANEQATNYSYDANGNLTQSVDANNRVVERTYDALNRIKKIVDPNFGETQFNHTSQDKIKTVTNARGNATTDDYDGLGNLRSQTSPETGTTTFLYDAAGNRTRSTDARGVVTNYTYDALNRLKTINYPAASAENVTLTYDGFSTTNKGIGHVTGISKSGVGINYFYNFQGLVNQKNTSPAGVAKAISFTYDKSGNVTRIIYPSGRSVFHTYDNLGRLNSITTKIGTGATQTLISNTAYLPFGPATSYKYGNNLTHSNQYDLDYRLTNIKVGGLLNRTYGYDPVDNITSIVNGLNASKNQSYSYDELNRLISATGGYGNLRYGYDSVGNRLRETRNGATHTYQYETTSNRLTGVTRTSGNRSFTYDLAGNPAQRTGENNSIQNFSFNMANRLSSVSVNGVQTATYTYNPLGQRVSKTLRDGSKELYYYDESRQLIAVLNGAGATVREYVYWNNQQIALINGSSIYYIHNDHLSTPQVITNQNQQVVWMGDYEPFGKVAANASNSIELFSRFPGQYLDSETGLYYNYFRDYDPSIGRYIESDPIGLAGGINTYAYVGSNPLVNVDPTGLFQVHGNWCGPDWTGGQIGSYSPHKASSYKEPIDRVDQSCKTHDICYHQCRQDNPCDKSARGQCFLKCDSVLSTAAWDSGGVSGTSVGAAMDRPGSREEPNEILCGCPENHPLHDAKFN